MAFLWFADLADMPEQLEQIPAKFPSNVADISQQIFGSCKILYKPTS